MGKVIVTEKDGRFDLTPLKQKAVGWNPGESLSFSEFMSEN